LTLFALLGALPAATAVGQAPATTPAKAPAATPAKTTTRSPAKPSAKTPTSKPAATPARGAAARGSVAPAPAPVPPSIDGLVNARLKELGITPAPVVGDATFLRRAYLDAIGTLPTADEARAFLADTVKNKRAQLVDRLLARDEFADYWAMKWSDLLRVKSEYPVNLWPNAVQAYHHWIRACLRANMPFDEFARALLTASGSNFREPPVNFWRAVQSRKPDALASAVALTFMGVRAEKWPPQRLAEMSAFFTHVGYKPTQEWKEEIVFFDPDKAPALTAATTPDGQLLRIAPDQDPRTAFAAWLTTPQNPFFTRAISNRVWSWLLGRGIVDEPDDIRPDNPPSNSALLTYLERELVTAQYDVKRLFRLVMTSETYQRASSGASVADARATANFAHYLERPLEAEVLIDAIDQVTGGTEEYSSQIPEPFTFVPEDRRTITLADGSITSPFLKTFGRSPRDLGIEYERDRNPSAAERLALLNSSQIQAKLDRSPSIQALLRSPRGPQQLATELYLAILSRPPTDAELQAALAYAQSANVNRRTAVLDLAWALMNTPEFLFRH
jgi:hypothetical protein